MKCGHTLTVQQECVVHSPENLTGALNIDGKAAVEITLY